MVNAFAAGSVVAVVAGVVGYFLVLRGEAFAGHALSHVGFTGATGAVLVGLSPLWGLVLMTVAGGVGMGFLGTRVGERDVAIGIVLSLALGLGLLFLHFFTAYATQATALLFGNILGVETDTIWVLLGLAVVTLGVVAVIARPLLFASLQPEFAEARGVPMRLVSVLFLAVVGLAVAECVQIVGVLLVFALIIGPAATAQRISGRFLAAIGISVALALSETWLGLALAYWTDWPVSFWISLLSTASYFAAAMFS
jgi:zinc/manganese transport system permease protein